MQFFTNYDFSNLLKRNYPFINKIIFIGSSNNTFFFLCKNKFENEEYILEMKVSPPDLEFDEYEKLELNELSFLVKFPKQFVFSSFMINSNINSDKCKYYISLLEKLLKNKYKFAKSIKFKSYDKNKIVFTIKDYFYDEEYSLEMVLSENKISDYEEINMLGFTFQVKFLEPMSYFILCRLKDHGIQFSKKTKESILEINEVSNQRFPAIDNQGYKIELCISLNIIESYNIKIKNENYENLCVVNIKYIQTLNQYLEKNNLMSQKLFFKNYLKKIYSKNKYSKKNTKRKTCKRCSLKL